MAASRHPVGSCAAAGTARPAARPAASTSHRKLAASTGVSTTMPRKSARNPLSHFRRFQLLECLGQNGLQVTPSPLPGPSGGCSRHAPRLRQATGFAGAH